MTYLIDDKSLVLPQVQLVGMDGNAFSILGRVIKAWKAMGRPDIAAEFQQRATSGDYNNLLTTAMEYIEEIGEEEEDEWNPYEDEEEEEDDMEARLARQATQHEEDKNYYSPWGLHEEQP